MSNRMNTLPEKQPYSERLACDPQRSVIVSACAGSGKTWLLVARMVRLLLDDVKPQEILALTFTRKAAQEMRDRLYGLLEQFSKSDDVSLMKELTARGIEKEQAEKYLPKAKALYEQVLANPQPIVIDTFHGWFGRLLGAAPVSMGIQPGFKLREDAKRLQEECLDDWWGDLTPELKAHYDVLLNHLGSHETQKLLMGKGSLFKQRGAWTFFAKQCDQAGITPIERLKQSLNKLNLPNPLLAQWNAPNALADLQFLARCFENSSVKDSDLLKYLLPAIACKENAGDVLEVAVNFQTTFLTKEPKYRSSNDKALGEAKKYLERVGEAHRIDEHIAIKQNWGHAFEEYLLWQAEQDIFAINEAWFALNQSMMAHANAQKENMRVRDFDDLELGVSLLMSDAANAAYLQSRLDAKYKQILVDEFQDTNPLQWQILLAWLAGYSEGDERPKVFIVGDPKQSIYRFRRADPRLFVSAAQFLHQYHAAVYIEQDKTRRNAGEINKAVNVIFQGEQVPPDYPYSEQQTLWTAPVEGKPSDVYAQQGEIYLLPLIPYVEQTQELREGSAFDGAIADSSETVGVIQRQYEGELVARLIQEVIATRKVADKEGGKEIWRDARASDFLLLVKRRKYLPQYERALRDVKLAYESPRLGGLLNTLEIDDLIALLTVLVTPRHDLPLAQVLRTPIFGFTEKQMQQLAVAMTSGHYRSWWDALQDSRDVKLQVAARYLKHWHLLGERLPVHDLLDRIYQEGDVRLKYAAVCQDLDRPQVLANLDAFLEVALNQDGGQYPSLSRFIQEINIKRRGDDDETPDEGDVDAASDENLADVDEESEMSEEDRHKRVRLMTIHGAKGLESPFVIILDANNTDTNVDYSGVLIDWSPQEEGPSHLSMFTSKTLTSPRSEINEAEKQIGEKENWNLLYVAMTRARQGLWISGDAQKPTANNPSGLDKASWYGKASNAGLTVYQVNHQAAVTEETEAIKSSKENAVEDFVLDWNPAQESHIQMLSDIESGVTVEVFAGEGERVEDPDPEILEEGTNFHKLLEFLTPDSSNETRPPMPSEQELMNWLGVDEEHAKTLIARTKTVLEAPELKRYLASGEWLQAWNELDIASEDGKSYRMDRLVELADHLAIIDYKLTIPEVGSEKYEKYRKQLQGYQAELTRIRKDKPNKAYLISSKGEMVEVK
ncbi:UvrD-helicase domain-containing protein [Polynucleobacter sp. AP-Nickl1-40-C4]|uniref:UvrD-helicase domain-containing protein n=1 Tax=Polynucleobacter sp. AP-Nickl1-40-C4 TaxID=3108275 RepID=UPI002B23BD3C|nr:UvrD-helicase domain-containing protein [Polynucleobacter sp. AP-Nickl1-40-C4]MEA9566964.1 UvrD-helicase domain-containing protein [Polynucleobacter sp. AP-Nickl1-40-C4]